VARQFNLIPPVCEQAEYHMFQREKVEVQLPELFHKIGECVFFPEKSHFNTVAEMVHSTMSQWCLLVQVWVP